MNRALTLAKLLIAAVFLFTVFRAANQSIVYDEAHAYFWFLDGPWANLLRFNVNNHILYTFLAKISVELFGLSELALRIPSLIGTALYLWSVFTITKRIFKSARSFLIVLGLLTLNPLLLDFFCLGRGYCLALGFYTWGLATLLFTGWESNPTPRRAWITASICFALSILASLTFGFVCIATVAAYCLGLASRKKPALRELLYLFFPGPLLLVAAFSPYLSKVKLNQFGAAFDRADLALVDLFNASFFRFQTSSRNMLTIGLPQEPNQMRGTPWTHEYASSILLAVVVSILLSFLFFAIKALRARESELHQRALILINGSLALVALMQVTAHLSFGLKYPTDRMALFAVPLVTLGVALLPFRMPRIGSLLGACILALYLQQLDWSGSRTWRYAASTKNALSALEAAVVSNGHFPATKVRLGGVWLHFPCVSFYRLSRNYTWLAEYPNEAVVNPAQYDYLLFHPDEFPALGPSNLETTLYRDPTSGIVLAKMRGS